MNQTKSNLQIPYQIEDTALASVPVAIRPRLVVVVLGVENEALLANRIAALAQPHGWPVALVGIAVNPQEEAALRRRLVTVAAFLRDHMLPETSGNRGSTPGGRVEIRLEHGRNWLENVRRMLSFGDLLACSEDETIGIPKRLLSDVLSRALDTTIYTFASLSRADEARPNLLLRALPWIGSLASMGGFLALQARIVIATQGAMQTSLLLLSLFGEVGLIWLLNSWFGQA